MSTQYVKFILRMLVTVAVRLGAERLRPIVRRVVRRVFGRHVDEARLEAIVAAVMLLLVWLSDSRTAGRPRS
jgi:hypothetical protein